MIAAIVAPAILPGLFLLMNLGYIGDKGHAQKFFEFFPSLIFGSYIISVIGYVFAAAVVVARNYEYRAHFFIIFFTVFWFLVGVACYFATGDAWQAPIVFSLFSFPVSFVFCLLSGIPWRAKNLAAERDA